VVLPNLSTVEAETDPAYLRALLVAVTEFRDALTELLSLYVSFGTHVARGIAPPVVPRDGADRTEIDRLSSSVSRAAGRAAAAGPLTGTTITIVGLGTVDPIAAWRTITHPSRPWSPMTCWVRAT
jgi:hypothetical protein